MKKSNSTRPNFFLLNALIAFFLCNSAYGRDPAFSSTASFKSDDTTIFAPSKLPVGTRVPLILLLHGYMGNKDVINAYFGYEDFVESRKFILVVPNGAENSSGLRYWNASPACCDFDHRNNDDVKRLEKTLSEVIAKYPVDRQRIFVVGHSNGGFMAHRLACDFSEVVTGIISFAGAGTMKREDCRPTRPISVLQIHAEDDDTILFPGDRRGYEGLTGYPSVEQTVGDWSLRDSCQLQTELSDHKIDLTISIPGPDAKVITNSKCSDNTEVTLWKIQPYKNIIHFPHTPLLTNEFTQRTLDFVFFHQRP